MMSLEPRARVQRVACPSPPISPLPCSSPARICQPCLGNSGGRPGQWWGWGAGEGRLPSLSISKCSLSTCCEPGIAKLPCPAPGVDSGWRSSEGPGAQPHSGTGRGPSRAQEPLSLARLSVGSWSAAPGSGRPPGWVRLHPHPSLPFSPHLLRPPSSGASLATPPCGSWAFSTQAGRLFTPVCSQQPAGGSWPILQAQDRGRPSRDQPGQRGTVFILDLKKQLRTTFSCLGKTKHGWASGSIRDFVPTAPVTRVFAYVPKGFVPQRNNKVQGKGCRVCGLL